MVSNSSNAFAEVKKEILNTLNTVIMPEAATQLLQGGSLIDTAKNVVNLYEAYQITIQDYTEITKTIVRQAKALRKVSSDSIEGEDLSQAIEKAKQQTRFLFTNLNVENKLRDQLIELQYAIKAFQQVVQEVLKTEIKMVFVTEGSSTSAPRIFDLTEVAMADYLYLDRAAFIKGGNITLRFKDLSADTLQKLGAQEIKNNNEQYQEQIDNLYKEIMRRIEIAKTKSGGNYLMYWLGNEWNLVKINTLGDIAEAYTNLVVNYMMYESQEQWLSSGSYDEQIHYFVNKYLYQVNNASGFLQEDVVTNNGALSLGVKTGGAQTMGLVQVYSFAKLIIAGSASNKELGSFARTFAGTSGGSQRNKHVAINQQIEKAIDDLDEETLNQLDALFSTIGKKH